VNNDQLIKLAEEAVRDAYRDGYRKGYVDGSKDATDSAIRIVEEKFAPLEAKSLLKAVPSG
jgi:flagellar biosynthesis/type III secretory pathway protein FliH